MSGCRSASPDYSKRVTREDGTRQDYCRRCGAPCRFNPATSRWSHGAAPTAGELERVRNPRTPYDGCAWATPVDRAAPITMGTRNGAPTWRGVWGSWTAWLDYACQEPPPGLGRQASRGEGDDEFYGKCSWSEAVDLARNGWHDAIMDVDAAARAVAYKVIGEKLDRHWTFPRDVTGECVDVPAFLSGEPECMIDPTPDETMRAGNVVRLAVPITCASHVPETLYRERGAAIVALVDVLRQAGYALEIVAVHAVNSTYSQVLPIQSATDPVDIGRIMFAIAHPTSLRRIAFSAQERVRDSFRKNAGVGRDGHGYGMPNGVEDDVVPAGDGVTIRLPMLHASDDWSPEAAERWIVSTLDDLAG